MEVRAACEVLRTSFVGLRALLLVMLVLVVLACGCGVSYGGEVCYGIICGPPPQDCTSNCATIYFYDSQGREITHVQVWFGMVYGMVC